MEGRGGRLNNDPERIRYGCFLPDLTGLASGPSIANLPPDYTRDRRGPVEFLSAVIDIF